MGASLNTGRNKGGGFRRRHPAMSEINVTPFVDVMLVLLIVFMVAAPLLTIGVPIDLPQSKARPLPEDSQPLSVSIDRDGNIYLQDAKVGFEELVPRLSAIADNKLDARIYVRADHSITYGRVMEVMGAMNAAGFTKVALVSQNPVRKK